MKIKLSAVSVAAISLFGLAGSVGLLAMPASAAAATVYLQASRAAIHVGDTAVIAVKIDADGAVLNAVSGNITLATSTATNKGKLAVDQFALAGSAFGLWPRTPSLSADGRTISFIGGVPGGFSIEDATIFDIIVTATTSGTVTISPQDIAVYANDGKGTVVPSTLKGLTITVTPLPKGTATVNDWSALVSSDTTAPQPFIIVMGQDPSVLDGKKFAFFSAVDTQSGIDYYEVSENGGAYVRSGSTYVLQDQTDANVTLSVVAYDKAGNHTIATYPNTSSAPTVVPSQPSSQAVIAHWAAIIASVIIILIVAVSLGIFMKMRKVKNGSKKK